MWVWISGDEEGLPVREVVGVADECGGGARAGGDGFTDELEAGFVGEAVGFSFVDAAV